MGKLRKSFTKSNHLKHLKKTRRKTVVDPKDLKVKE